MVRCGKALGEVARADDDVVVGGLEKVFGGFEADALVCAWCC
jgi:hypothetical protein